MRRIIWTYWHQGFDNAPFVVKQCIKRIQKLHPDDTIYLLDAQNIYDFAETVPIQETKWDKLSLPHRSDLLRTQLLIRNGGTWLDPTVFCLRPLDTWLPDMMDKGIFLFHRPGKDRIISNWFIAAEKNNYLLQQLYDALIDYWNEHDFRNLESSKTRQVEYWSKRIINGRSLELSQLWLSPFFTKILRLHPYMIYHYMFYRLIRKDPKCKAIYEAMPKISADGPHRLQRLGLLDPVTKEGQNLVRNKEVPLLKLKWKIDPEKVSADSHLSYLFNS